LDATQTSEPTETGPASAGQASAFRRALDDQAATEGPLDLTAPLDIAEVRAALSNSGPLPAVRADLPPRTPAGGPGGPGSTPPHGPAGRRSRRHAGSKRLGRLAVFVVFAALASFGTAYALVISSGGQGSSVSLPPTNGNIPVAPSEKTSGQGQLSFTAGSTPAKAAPSPSHSPKPVVQSASAPTSEASTTAAATGTADPSTGPSQSADPSGSAGQASGSAPAGPTSSGWVTLYWGIQNESPEVAQVQSMLADLGYLDGVRHHAYFNPQVDVQPDPSGTYGSATEDAVAEFQQVYGVDTSAQPGECDLATYQALTQAAG
jgi:hypothetical protein